MAGKLIFTLEEFQEAATKYRKDLLMLPIIGIQETLKYMTSRPGIRYKENVGALSGDAQFGPYKPSRSTDFNLNVDFRTLETFMGSVVAKFEPNSAVSSQPLKSSHTRVHETCRALNEVFKLAEDLKNPSLNKSQKSPHGSLEVKCGGCKHDIDGVSEKTLVEVAS